MRRWTLDRRDEDVPADVGGGPVAGVDVPDGDGDLGAGLGQRPGGLDPDAGGAPGDDGAPAGQVDPGEDLGRGGLPAERPG
jgi:hypothetical protein